MGSEILARSPGAVDEQAFDRARVFVENSQAPSTRRAHASHLRAFVAFCEARGFLSFPASAQTVALYVTELAGTSKVGTIRHRLVAIGQAHRERGLESPASHEFVRRLVRGVARTNGTAQTKKAAITLDELRRMLLCVRGDDTKARRDRALLLLGFAGALRRSELAGLDVDDLSWSKSGLKITIRRSKTDQTGEGVEIPIPIIADRALCAVRAVREWLDSADIVDGPLFRSFAQGCVMKDRRIDGTVVAALVKNLAHKARLDGDFGAHSLRAGFVTAAAQARVGLDRIAAVTRHKSLTVLCGYVRRANLFEDPVLVSIVAPQAQKAVA